MIKVLSIVNSVVLIVVVGGAGFLYTQRTKFVNDMLLTIQDQVIENIKDSIKTPALPKATGNVLPF